MDLSEFLAEEELIEIIPNFKYAQQLNLISGDFGPFMPSIPVQVPMWMALNLHRKHKCRIVMPRWIINLIKDCDAQDRTPSLIQIPSEYWRETIKLLERVMEIMPNTAGIVERREAILRTSAHMLFKHAFRTDALFMSDVTVENVSRCELQIIKNIVQKAFAYFQRIRVVVAQAQIQGGKTQNSDRF